MELPLEVTLEEKGVDATVHEFNDSTKSATDAAKALGADLEHIIKSLLFFVDEDPVLVVVRGTDRVDTEKLGTLWETDDVRIADHDEVEEITGYTVGAVPPILPDRGTSGRSECSNSGLDPEDGCDVPKVIDEAVLEYDTVFAGGGATNKILEIDPRFVVDEHDLVADVA